MSVQFRFEPVNKGVLPVRGTKYSAGFDCFANEDVIIPDGGIKTVSLGFRISDFGYWVAGSDSYKINFISMLHLLGDGNLPYLELHLRSSLRKNGLFTGGVGIIDADYRGEVKLIVSSVSGYKVLKGQKIAQIIARETNTLMLAELETVKEVRNGGFGSTGS
tara:strand:- start:2976 stop:3461 length:486 start_codon:yes stop_codon:yes gene_type:complete